MVSAPTLICSLIRYCFLAFLCEKAARRNRFLMFERRSRFIDLETSLEEIYYSLIDRLHLVPLLGIDRFYVYQNVK